MLVIGLSANRDKENDKDCMPPDYVKAVLRAGAVPLVFPLLPPDSRGYDQLVQEMVKRCDGFVLTGGPDLHPSLYGESPLPGCGDILPQRDKMDLALLAAILESGKPLLGICRGLQLVNVHFGGTLWQDLASQFDPPLLHQQTETGPRHKVRLLPGTLLHQVTQKQELTVNTRHHQAIKNLPPGLMPCAMSEDGLIEAIAMENNYPALCVQWHPENLSGEDPAQQALFDWLVASAGQCG